MKPEARLSRDVQKALKTIGCAVYSTEQGYRAQPGGTRTSAGIPDLIVFVDGVFTFAELKTAKGKLTTAQDGFRLACEDANIPWQLWRSVTDALIWAEDAGIIRIVED